MTASAAMPATAEVISLSEELVSIRGRPLQQFAREVGEYAFARAGACDEDGAYPAADVAALRESGLITAVFPPEFGGAALSGSSLSEVLQSIGSGSLPLGRLFEGHVNAIELVLRYGDRDQLELLAREAQEGKLFGVWNTDDSNNLRLIRSHGRYWLEGRKILASGAGHIERPLVTATDEEGRRLMTAQIEAFRLCRSLGMEGARHARFGDRRRRFHRRPSRAYRNRRRRRRLRAATLVFRGRMALCRGASGRHAEIA
jgi:alkylation response protein AidB-like acyl-CoA dehydrogenase